MIKDWLDSASAKLGEIHESYGSNIEFDADILSAKADVDAAIAELEAVPHAFAAPTPDEPVFDPSATLTKAPDVDGDPLKEGELPLDPVPPENVE